MVILHAKKQFGLVQRSDRAVKLKEEVERVQSREITLLCIICITG
jgi:hypothetical protein